MISLNVGPSHLAPEVLADISDIVASGLLSESHRGPAVMETVSSSVSATRRAMRLPEDYTFLFQPSATAAMELIVRNLVARSSFHFVQGAFSKRFADTARLAGKDATSLDLPWDEVPDVETVAVPAEAELVSLPHGETSTGAMWPDRAIRRLRERFPEVFLIADATSTFGALASDWTLADVWFGSVQKCVGLPAGLGYVLLSPRAMEKAAGLGDARGVASWQDVLHMRDRLATGQTVETPNVLDIALLGRQMARRDIDAVEAQTREKAAYVRDRFGDASFYIRDPAWRSLTTHNVRVEDPAGWLARANAAGHRLGAGYGPLRSECIRIPTYPAVSLADLETVLDAAE
jgi:phosphoserine aminotransferase